MSRRLAFVLTLLLVPLSVSGGRREPQQMMQATEVERGWVVSIDQRRARLRAPDGARQSFRVRRGEHWLNFSEFRAGWMAAGIKPGRNRLDLKLVANFGHGVRRLPQPPERQGTMRTRPTPIVSSFGPQGLAWLEGDSLTRMAVRAAPFDEGSFGAVSTVSPAGMGSQTGLSATVLADGTWLLVWSRFDGRDDEIYWAARYPGGSWTAPRRLTANNSTPDISPGLLPHGDGALVAWSRLEDEYEVVTATFSNGAWSSPRRLGVPGSLSPTFRRVRDRDYLLVRNAWPAGWTAFRFDETGAPADFAVVAEESSRPPVLRTRGGSSLALEWPGRKKPAALAWEPVR